MKPKKKHDEANQKSWMISALERLQSSSDMPFIIESEGPICTRAEFYRAVIVIAQYLSEHGVTEDSWIILDIDTNMHWQVFAAWFACQALGATACFWPPDMRFRHESEEIQEADSDTSSPALVLTGTLKRAEQWNQRDSEHQTQRPILCLDPFSENIESENIKFIGVLLRKATHKESEFNFALADDTAARVYTQGSHQQARPVFLSYQHLQDQAKDLQSTLKIDENSRVFIDLQTPHTACLTVFAACLLTGCPFICRSQNQDIQPILQKHQVTHAFLLAQNIQRMKEEIQRPSNFSHSKQKWRSICLNAGKFDAHQQRTNHHWSHPLIQKLCINPLKAELFSHLNTIISYGSHFNPKDAEFYSGIGIEVMNAYTISELGFIHIHQFMGKGCFLKSIDAQIRNGILSVKSKRSSNYISMDDLVFEDERNGICTHRNFSVTLKNGAVVDVSPMREILNRHAIIEEIFIFGQDRPYLTALIYLNPKELQSWCIEQKLPDASFEELAQNSKVYSYVRELVDACNLRRGPNESIQKIAILPKKLEEDPRTMTPCGLTRRTAVEHRYAPLLDSFYSDNY